MSDPGEHDGLAWWEFGALLHNEDDEDGGDDPRDISWDDYSRKRTDGPRDWGNYDNDNSDRDWGHYD